MRSSILRRLLLTLPVLLGVVTLVFSFIHLVPGDPVQIILGEGAQAADVEQLRHKLGLGSKPVWALFEGPGIRRPLMPLTWFSRRSNNACGTGFQLPR